MTAIDERLPDSDGLKWFNRLYLQVTRSVRQAVAGPAFHDARFMSELDVVFANLYFAAIAEGEIDVSRAPSAWRPLLRCRMQRGDCAVAVRARGHERAHQSRSAAGIVEVFTTLGGDPTSDAARRQDFDSVNELLERVEGEIKGDFSIGVIGEVDVLAGRVDDVAAMWNVRVARHAAWTNAEVLWTLQRTPRVRTAFFDTLDRSTGLAGRGLLKPIVLDATA